MNPSLSQLIAHCSLLVAFLLGLLSCLPVRAAESSPTASAEHSDGATTHHRFDNVEFWQSIFDDPKRDAWQLPEKVVAALKVRPGMCVADLGAGTGYFVRHLSAAVGPTGTVLAVEPEPNLVSHLRDRAEKEGTDNVVPILASLDNPRLPTAVVDVILVVDTFHHFDHRRTYLPQLRRFLRPGGRVVIIDWFKRPLPEGPPPDHKLTRDQVVAEMTASGYELSEQPDFLPYQYFLIFQEAMSDEQ